MVEPVTLNGMKKILTIVTIAAALVGATASWGATMLVMGQYKEKVLHNTVEIRELKKLTAEQVRSCNLQAERIARCEERTLSMKEDLLYIRNQLESIQLQLAAYRSE